jgi:alkaline phosphatase D
MAELRRRDPAGGSAPLYSTDGWDANPASRDRVLRTWVDAKTSNPLAIGGDMHSFAASDLRLTPDSPVIAPAFVGGTISSPGDEAKMVELKAGNPDFRFASYQHGYTLVDVTPAVTHLEYRALSDVTDAKSEAFQLAKFVMEDGARGGVRWGRYREANDPLS